jgi:exodeoxyribonuclease VII small subunit
MGSGGDRDADLETMTFEEAFRRLEETVRTLEQGDLPIDDLVSTFEGGMALARLCGARLDAAELRITRLVPDENGGSALAPFDE